MLNMERSFIRREVLDSAGNPVILVTERLTVSIARRRAAVGASYERPFGIERDGVVRPIVDLVMITKLVGLLAVLLAMIVRTVRR